MTDFGAQKPECSLCMVATYKRNNAVPITMDINVEIHMDVYVDIKINIDVDMQTDINMKKTYTVKREA